MVPRPMNKLRGLANRSPLERQEIARMGGQAAHRSGNAPQFTSETGRIAGKKGGDRVSADRAYMAALGRKGGAKVSADREHMARIGKLGGQRRHAKPA